MKVAVVGRGKAKDIAKLAVCLTNEIIDRTGVKCFDVDESLAVSLCESFIKNAQYHVIAAFDEEVIIGFAALCESHSLYAEGSFGVVQEFYVMPEYRSQTVGQQLIKKVVEFANEQSWKRLELCTPPLPEFSKTVRFYQANGFEITGGYKMKRTIG